MAIPLGLIKVAKFLQNCSAGNWERITTIQLHFSGAPYVGDLISPSLQRLWREVEITCRLSHASEIFIHQIYGQFTSHSLRATSTICMTKISLVVSNAQIMSQC